MKNPVVAVTTAGQLTLRRFHLNASLSNCILRRKRRRRKGVSRMANVLPRAEQIRALNMLVEGASLRSVTRLTGIHRTTLQKLLARFGHWTRAYLDLHLSNLSVRSIEVDELWTFCRKKQGKLKGRELSDPGLGDVYLFLALDNDTKLICTYALGKRNAPTTDAFIADLAKRIVRPPQLCDDSPQLSTDGWSPYPGAVSQHFGGAVRHGILIKNYVNPEVGRYAPPKLVNVDRIEAHEIDDLRSICTSHIERHNLTVRTFMRRFTRLTVGFSKKLDNLAAAAALHVGYYNFCWRPRMPGKSGKLRPTPAQAAGLTDSLWTFERFYDEVCQHGRQQKRAVNVGRLIERLRGK